MIGKQAATRRHHPGTNTSNECASGDAHAMTPVISGDLGWYYHTGPHAATPQDWKVFLQFLDKYFK